MEDIPCHSFPCLVLLRDLMERKPRDNDYAEFAYLTAKRGFGSIGKYFLAYNSSRNYIEREYHMGRIKAHVKQVSRYLKTDISDAKSADFVAYARES